MQVLRYYLEIQQRKRNNMAAKKKKKKSKSRVNEAGNYTKPTMRKTLFNKIKACFLTIKVVY